MAITFPTIQFVAQHARLFFANFELTCESLNITKQRQKFRHLINLLPMSVQLDVEGLIIDPPSESPYDTIKEALLRKLTDSDDAKLQQILEHETLGDRKPSQLLAAMRRAAIGFNFPDNVMRALWLRKLPHSCKQILLGMDSDCSLDRLAEKADAICSSSCDQTIASVSSTSNHAFDRCFTKLEELIDCLAVDKLHQNRGRRSTDCQRRPPSRQTIANDQQNSPDSGVCWYHRKFGDAAKRCTKPCRYSTNKSGNGFGDQ